VISAARSRLGFSALGGRPFFFFGSFISRIIS
jgi:hypothetical protein